MKSEEFLELMVQRQSARAFGTTCTVDRETIARILEEGLLALSACNA